MDSLLGHRIKLLLGAIGTVAGLWFIYQVRGILAPFVLAFVLAYVLTPLVDRMEGRGLKRTPSILLIFLAFFAALAFGVVTLGKQMTAQMVDLSGEFLRKERSQASLTITNTDKRVLTVEVTTQSDGERNPFAIFNRDEGLLILEPGQETTIEIEFVPDEVKPYSGALVLQGLVVPYSVPLRGNIEDSSGTWKKQHEGAYNWGKLGFSARGLDLGMAGPNVISRVSAQARAVEPFVQPVMALVGAEADLATLVKTHGSQLIDVLLGRTTDLLSGLVSGIMLVVIVPFVAFFFLKEGRRITHGLIELVPNGYFEMTLNLLHSINNSIGGYIRGQLLAVTVVALMSVIGLSLIGMDYALPVGIVAGLANMIPYLGPLIGIVSASVVALATLGGTAMITKVVFLFLFIQIVDNVLVQPVVVAKSVDLHPLMVMVVVMIGSDLWGMVGMLIAVPVTGILKVSATTVYEGLQGYRVS